ncbi:hypothetical protein ACFE04_007062 [Oxalis oulophora]
MKEYQTPQQSRPSDPLNRKSKESQLKKSQKMVKKNLNVDFTYVAEDASSFKESSDVSVISELSDSNRITDDIAESFASYTPLDLTPCSNLTIVKLEESPKDIVECHDCTNSTGVSNLSSSFSAADLKLTEYVLKQALSQVWNLVDADTRNEKLLDAIIRTIKEAFEVPTEKRVRKGEAVFMKFPVANLCFFLCTMVAALIFVFRSALGSSGRREATWSFLSDLVAHSLYSPLPINTPPSAIVPSLSPPPTPSIHHQTQTLATTRRDSRDPATVIINA